MMKILHVLVPGSIIHPVVMFRVRVMVFNATFNSISVVLWRSVFRYQQDLLDICITEMYSS
jgi:hypothetical protein